MGKPVFHKNLINAAFGCWMKDPAPRLSNETIWVTVNESSTLLEYSNKSMFKTNSVTRSHTLTIPYHVSDTLLQVIV